ncbi:hypothetical protein RJ641_000294 [Dillenia turbinata]|uniref:Uncharacterized protein n=1 Tax=Dillenia turbinata TaxID=194707 RepID=A0AAN8WDM0_9MAGN
MGGGVMRAAAKSAGVGVVHSAMRSMPSVPKAEHSVSAASRSVSRSISAVAATADGKPGVVLSVNTASSATLQKPSWEVDDWDFVNGEEDRMVLKTAESMPRLVFGGVPSLDEAKEATFELKEALEKVYLSSPRSTVSADSSLADKNSENVETTKACVTSEASIVFPGSKSAIQAFKFLKENTDAQHVVASIASDPNVWNAVMQNGALQEYLESRKIGASCLTAQPYVTETVAEGVLKVQESAKTFEYSSHEDEPNKSRRGRFICFLMNVKRSVVEMVSNLPDFLQNLFEGPASEKVGADDEDQSGQGKFFIKALEATSLFGLVVLVIMVVVLKRG